MTIEAELPDGTILEFPDGTSDDIIQGAVKSQLGVASQPEAPKEQLQQTMGGDSTFKAAQEFASAVNRGVINLVDVPTHLVNAVGGLLGIESKIKPLGEQAILQPMIEGGQLDDGILKTAIRAGGEAIGPGAAAGGALRQIGKSLPQAGSMVGGLVRNMGAGTVGTDIVVGGASGAGAGAGGELGESIGGKTGGLVGSIIGGLAASVSPFMLAGGMRGIANGSKKAVDQLIGKVKQENLVSDDVSILLNDLMVREGLTPDEARKALTRLGDEAMPGDLGDNFRDAIRSIGNKIPRVAGVAKTETYARQMGQADRIMKATDDATGTLGKSVREEIQRLDDEMAPLISGKYKEAHEQALSVSDDLNDMFNTKGSSIYKARQKAEQVLIDKELAGDPVGALDIVDATKKSLDDMIQKAMQKGERNKAMWMIKQKNLMLDDVDSKVPAYAEARGLFAGKASLQSAADQGLQFRKLKADDIDTIVSGYSSSEMEFFKLGAKKALLDEINNTQATSNSVKKMFGKNGDSQKLRALFDDEEAFKKFNDAMKSEAEFTMTRNAATGNSTTSTQQQGLLRRDNALADVAEIMADPTSINGFKSIFLKGLKKLDGSAEFIKSQEMLGDLLLTRGYDPVKIQRILRQGNRKVLEKTFRDAIAAELSKRSKVATGAAILDEGFSTEDKQEAQQ